MSEDIEKNIGGRPALYKTPEELQAKFDEYVKEKIDEEKRPTMAGTAYHLGFESRQSLYDYENRDGFSYTIKRIRLFIETIYEENVEKGAGFIFALKNFGWTDKTEVDNNITFPNSIEINFIDDKPKD